jgi:hypothetical protein
VYKHLNKPDVRVVATGTILDGYVLALSSFASSMNYRSAVLHGFTLPIGTQPGDDPVGDKTEAFSRITNRTIPGRWEHARQPTQIEFKGTAIIRVIIDSARYVFYPLSIPYSLDLLAVSAKVRAGPPVDDKKVAILFVTSLGS